MTTTNYTQVLDNLILISIHTNIWSGKKKLRPEDLGGANLPPEKLASLGSKRVYDPEALKAFHTLKRQAERLCESVGTRFLGCYAVPKDAAPGLMDGLAEIQKEFDLKRDEFLAEYDQVLSTWLNDAGEWRDAIAKAVEDEASVRTKLNFSVAAYAVGIPETLEVAAPLMQQHVEGLSGQLIREIGQEAKASWQDSFRGKTIVTRKAIRPLKGILDKLKGLLFVDPGKFAGLVTNIEAALDAVPKRAPITGAPLMGLIGVLHECADLAGFVTAKEAAEIAEAEEAVKAEAEKEAEAAKAKAAKVAEAKKAKETAKAQAKAESKVDSAAGTEVAETSTVEPAEVWFW